MDKFGANLGPNTHRSLVMTSRTVASDVPSTFRRKIRGGVGARSLAEEEGLLLGGGVGGGGGDGLPPNEGSMFVVSGAEDGFVRIWEGFQHGVGQVAIS